MIDACITRHSLSFSTIIEIHTIMGKFTSFTEINLNLYVLYFMYECTNSFNIYVNFLRVNTESFP